MKNILITGGCGFIGTNFIEYVLTLPDLPSGIRVINLDKLTYAGNPENLDMVLDKVKTGFPGREAQYHFFQGDICDKNTIEDIFQQFDIDAVCHFAAESHVDRSIAGPEAFIHANIVGTFNLLETARKYLDRLAVFHHVSTDEVFGSLGKYGHFTEQSPYDPSSPYSASKAASDHLVRAYHRSFGLPITITNCSNNYGPFQYPEKLIPLMVLNANDGKPLPVYGRGLNIRDWLYVTDHCRAIWLVMNHGAPGETYNVGGECEKKNIDVVTTICDILDRIQPDSVSRKKLISYVDDKKIRPGHDFRYAIDFSKIQTTFGWAPDVSFDQGLEKTIQWYLANGDWVDRVKTRCASWIETTYGKKFR